MEALHAAGRMAELREGEAADAQRGLPVPLAPLAAQQAAAGVSPEAVLHGDFAAGLATVPELKVESPDRDVRSPGPRAAAKLERVARAVLGRGWCCHSRPPIGIPMTRFSVELIVNQI
jgi:hypothetical protein